MSVSHKSFTQAIRSIGVKAAALALLLGVVAPVLHALAHPDHIFSAPWSEAWDSRGNSTAGLTDTGKRTPATPQPSDHDCVVCQTLGSLVAPAPSHPPMAVPPLLVEASLYPTALPDPALAQTPHLRPQGRAPPTSS